MKRGNPMSKYSKKPMPMPKGKPGGKGGKKGC
jgi:hypothetical protein